MSKTMEHNVNYLCYRMKGSLTKEEAWLLTRNQEDELYEFVKEQHKAEMEFMAKVGGMGI